MQLNGMQWRISAVIFTVTGAFNNEKIEDLHKVTQKVMNTLQSPVLVNNVEFTITASVIKESIIQEQSSMIDQKKLRNRK